MLLYRLLEVNTGPLSECWRPSHPVSHGAISSITVWMKRIFSNTACGSTNG
jgi:hypothetical protein